MKAVWDACMKNMGWKLDMKFNVKTIWNQCEKIWAIWNMYADYENMKTIWNTHERKYAFVPSGPGTQNQSQTIFISYCLLICLSNLLGSEYEKNMNRLAATQNHICFISGFARLPNSQPYLAIKGPRSTKQTGLSRFLSAPRSAPDSLTQPIWPSHRSEIVIAARAWTFLSLAYTLSRALNNAYSSAWTLWF